MKWWRALFDMVETKRQDTGKLRVPGRRFYAGGKRKRRMERYLIDLPPAGPREKIATPR